MISLSCHEVDGLQILEAVIDEPSQGGPPAEPKIEFVIVIDKYGCTIDCGEEAA